METKEISLSDLAAHLNLAVAWPEGVIPDDNLMIHKVAPIETAEAGSITFLSDVKYARYLQKSRPTALIARELIPGCSIPQLIHRDPHLIFAKTSELFYQVDHGPLEISDRAFIHPEAKLGKNIRVYPHAYIAKGAKIGDNVVLYPGVFIGADASIGAGSVLHANTSVGAACIVGENNLIHASCVIGADGFGFAAGDGEIVKIPQLGIARTGNHVELGGCCTIDRATMGETYVGDGTKFDSRVHVGHNSKIGQNCMFSALTAVAGSTQVGDWCLAGGQAAIGGHIKIGNGVKIGAKAGVINDVEDGLTVMGFPAQPAMVWRRARVIDKKLPDVYKTVKTLERRIAQLEDMLNQK